MSDQGIDMPLILLGFGKIQEVSKGFVSHHFHRNTLVVLAFGKDSIQDFFDDRVGWRWMIDDSLLFAFMGAV